MRKVKFLSPWAWCLAVVIFTTPAWSDQFDWRAYPGDAKHPAGNYITPVRDQGTAGTCWAFCTAAAVEANYDITYNILNSALDLSEQNLVCAGCELGFGDSVYGGYQDQATDYVRSTGITTESKVPYTGTNSSPNWPLTAPYTLYRVTSMLWRWGLNADPASIKNYLKTYGPIEAAVNSNHDFISPSNPPHYSGGVLTGSGLAATSSGSSLAPLDGPDGATLNHAILIVGYTDDSNVSGGGYWHIKNSWGSTWGPTGDGYGYISYGTMQTDDYLSLIDGTSFTTVVPEPATMSLLVLGTLAVLLRRRKA